MIDWQLNGLETVNPRRQNRRKIKAEKKEKKKREEKEKTHTATNNAPVSKAPINANHG